jgi:hypothetical protein
MIETAIKSTLTSNTLQSPTLIAMENERLNAMV